MTQIVTDAQELEDVQSLFGSPSRAQANLQLPSETRVTDPDEMEEVLALFGQQVDASERQELLNDITNVDADENPPTWADWVSPSLSLAGSLVAAGKGFSRGQQIASMLPPVPQVQAIARPVLGTAFAAGYTGLTVFGTTYAGNNIEDLVEGREVNPDRAFQEAVDAAQTDAILTVAFPVVGQVAKIGYKGTKEGASKVLNLGKSKLTPEQIDKIVDFQKRLKNFDPKSTLTPAGSAGGKDWYRNWLTSVGAVSAFTRGQINNLVNSYDAFMGKQLDNVIQKFKGTTPFEQGKAVQTFVNQVDMAIDDIVAPMYQSIELAGGKVLVNPVSAGRELYDEFLTKYRGSIKTNPKTGEPVLDEFGNIQRNTAYPSSDIKTAVEELKNLPDDLSFFEAHKRLSMIKNRLYRAQTTMSPSPQQNELIDILKKTRDMYESVMDDAAETLNPALKKEYDKVTSFYKQGKTKVQQTYLQKLLEVGDPSQVGALLTQEGTELGVRQLNDLMKYADSIRGNKALGFKRKTALGGDPLSRVRKGYLEQMFKIGGEGGQKSVEIFREKLKDPKFRATFNVLFKNTDVPKRMDKILDDLDIIDAALVKGQGMQLSIASAELGVVKSQRNFLEKLRDMFPTIMAVRGIRQKSIDSYLDTLKTVADAQRSGSKIPQEYLMRIQNFENLAKAGAVTAALDN